jgi:hypothetical protein
MLRQERVGVDPRDGKIHGAGAFAEHQGRAAIADHETEAVRRVGGVQGQPGTSGAHYAQHRGDECRAAIHPYCGDRFAAEFMTSQARRYLIGALL